MMLRVLDCLTIEHDLRLVLLAAVVCIFGTLATLVVSDRAVRGESGVLWTLLTVVSAASTIWATHFIAVLAYRTGIPMTYDATYTAASYLAGVMGIGIGFQLALRGLGNPRMAVPGGAIIGLGVAVLHYLGMAALRFAGSLSYDSGLVTLSVVLAAGLGAAGIYVVTCCRDQPLMRAVAATLLISMTVSLHFTGMGAVQLQLGPSEPAGGFSRSVLVIAVTLAAFTVMLICLGSALLDKRIASRLAGEAERFRTLADGAREGLVVHQDGIVVDANAAACEMFGWSREQLAHSIDDWLDDSTTRWRALSPDEPMETVLPGAEGENFPAEICRRGIRLSNGTQGELLTVRDLTQRKESEARIAHLALHDPLTDLPNRRLFMELANKAISQAARQQERFALLNVDLDGFKFVNDMYGHSAGDELLKVVAARVSATIRDADVFARFGGDEFCILQSYAAQPSQAMLLAERLLDALSAPVRLTHSEVAISASIGIALYPTDGQTIDDLLRNADTAMYRAKADGKATCRFFEVQMDAALEARRRLESRLRLAVMEDRLEVAFQPLVRSDNHAPLGFEALVRWNDAECGAISPADFIPVAEETGLIVAIGETVMRRACREAAGWSQPLRVAVNLSAIQFRRKDLVDMVRKALEDSGLPGDRLELEVTESLLIDNRDEVLKILTELKTLGVRIAMDDFGTGYSSLSYLQSFPFDKIKIDRVFVSRLESGSQNASIVRAVASMGKSLNMRVVAEGVETVDQAQLLKVLDCDELQGFLIAKPMPAGAVEAYLRDAYAPTNAEVRKVSLRVAGQQT